MLKDGIEMRMGEGPFIVMILLLSMFGPLSTDMYLSALPVMVDDFNTNEAVMNMSLYMFMLTLSFCILFLGPLSDKYGRRRVLLTAMSVYTVSNAACCFVDNIWVFIALRIVQAVGSGGALVSGFALIKDCYEGRERGRILSLVAVLGILGPIVSPVIGTALINVWGWHATFVAPAAVSLICILLGLQLPSSLPAERLEGSVVQAVRRLGVVVRDRGFTLFMLMICVFTASQLAYISVSSYIYQDRFGLTTTEYSLALGAACILALVLSACLRRLHLRNLQMVAAVFVLGVVSLVMMNCVARYGWLLFMLSIVPCCSNTITARSFGFEILMNHHDGDNGSVSAVINFTTFVFAFMGMVIASVFPSDSFIYGISAVLLMSCTVFAVMWAVLRYMGYPVKNLKR